MKGDIQDTFQREISICALGMDSLVAFAYVTGYSYQFHVKCFICSISYNIDSSFCIRFC